MLGWDRAVREAVRLLLSFGSTVSIVSVEKPDAMPDGAAFVQGRPDDPEVLRRAGVAEAAAVLVGLPVADARAALAVAKTINPEARLVASVQEVGSGPALREAGAGLAVDAREEAGREMVRLMLAGEQKPSPGGGK